MGKLFEARTFRIIGMKVGVSFVAFVLRLIYSTCRVQIHGNLPKEDEKYVYAIWHGELSCIPLLYSKYLTNKHIASMISNHRDGDFVANIIAKFGARAVRGSTSNGAKAALKESIRLIDQGYSIAITPDGPRGPRHSVANGVVMIAKMRGLKVFTINTKVSSCWRFKSWDKSFLPKPFSVIEFYMGEPFLVDELSLEDGKVLVQQRLIQNAF